MMLLIFRLICDKITLRKAPMTGWQPPALNTGLPEYIGREVRDYGSCGYYNDIHGDNQLADFLWQSADCVSCLSRQEKQEEIKMPILSATQDRRCP